MEQRQCELTADLESSLFDQADLLISGMPGLARRDRPVPALSAGPKKEGSAMMFGSSDPAMLVALNSVLEEGQTPELVWQQTWDKLGQVFAHSLTALRRVLAPSGPARRALVLSATPKKFHRPDRTLQADLGLSVLDRADPPARRPFKHLAVMVGRDHQLSFHQFLSSAKRSWPTLARTAASLPRASATAVLAEFRTEA